MPEFSMKGQAFTIDERYSVGYQPTEAEALALNRLVQRNLRDAILAGRVASRDAAVAFAASDAALAKPISPSQSQSAGDTVDVSADLDDLL